MQSSNDMRRQSSQDSKQFNSTRYCRHRLYRVLTICLALALLACNLGQMAARSTPKHAPTRTPLPTLTPTSLLPLSPTTNSFPTTVVATAETTTPVPTFTPPPSNSQDLSPTPTLANAAAPQNTPAATPPPTPASTSIDLPTATPPPQTAGWSFAGVRSYPDPYGGGLLLYGDLVNDTGTTQELVFVSGTFYDASGQVIADAGSTSDYWPVDIIPPGGRLPFELTVLDIEQAAAYDLTLEAQPSDRTPHQDFEFANLDQWREEESYCLAGELQNLGAPLQEYVVIVAVLFDSQDRVLKFGEYYESGPVDQSLEFEICIDLINQDVARHELRAWGQ
jgi:hypothetical protein